MLRLVSLSMLLVSVHIVMADEVKVAVAANFTAPMKEITARFEQVSGHRVLASFGSTGKLYAQIKHGAPFEALLAADAKTPARLVEEGLASDAFTYAIGRLVLWSADEGLVDGAGKVLAAGGFDKLAIANPKTAPYGAAAVQVMESLGLYAALAPKLVRGDNIAQTYQFVLSRNAALGFVALSQVVTEASGSGWRVPQALYDPIRQDAVLLEAGQGRPAAVALLEYLRGPEARAVIESFGYGVEP